MPHRTCTTTPRWLRPLITLSTRPTPSTRQSRLARLLSTPTLLKQVFHHSIRQRHPCLRQHGRALQSDNHNTMGRLAVSRDLLSMVDSPSSPTSLVTATQSLRSTLPTHRDRHGRRPSSRRPSSSSAPFRLPARRWTGSRAWARQFQNHGRAQLPRRGKYAQALSHHHSSLMRAAWRGPTRPM